MLLKLTFYIIVMSKLQNNFYFKFCTTMLILNCEPMHIIFIIFEEIKDIEYSYKI